MGRIIQCATEPLRRRAFLGLAVTFVAGVVWVGWRWCHRQAAWVQAVRGGRYPGPVVPIDERKVRRPGHWLG